MTHNVLLDSIGDEYHLFAHPGVFDTVIRRVPGGTYFTHFYDSPDGAVLYGTSLKDCLVSAVLHLTNRGCNSSDLFSPYGGYLKSAEMALDFLQSEENQ